MSSVCREYYISHNKKRLCSGHVYVSHATKTSLLRCESDFTVLFAVLYCYCYFHLAVTLLRKTWTQYVYTLYTNAHAGTQVHAMYTLFFSLRTVGV